MNPIRISEVAKRSGHCRRHTLRKLLAMQRKHPEIEILIPRDDPADKWRVNLVGLQQAKDIEQHKPNSDMSARVGFLEVDARLAQKKIRRLEARVFGENRPQVQPNGPARTGLK
jgi:hypothetical protein